MFFPKEMARNLARRLDLSEAVRHSCMDHHVRGLHYLCLQRRPDLTIKLYVTDPYQISHDHNGFLLNPHDHRYSFHSFVLNGDMENVTFHEDCPDGKNGQWDRMQWHAEAKTFSLVHPTFLRVESVKRYGVGDGYFLEPHELHTIRVNKHRHTALLLFQYADTNADKPGRLYFPRDDWAECVKPRPMTCEQGAELLKLAGLR